MQATVLYSPNSNKGYQRNIGCNRFSKSLRLVVPYNKPREQPKQHSSRSAGNFANGCKNECRIRQARETELPIVVDVIMEAHKRKYDDPKMFEKLLGAYGQCIREKKQACLQHRQFRQWKEINKLKVQLAQIRGQTVDWAGTYETPQERRQVMLWMQKRKFVVLVAVRLRAPHGKQNAISNYIGECLSISAQKQNLRPQSFTQQNAGIKINQQGQYSFKVQQLTTPAQEAVENQKQIQEKQQRTRECVINASSTQSLHLNKNIVSSTQISVKNEESNFSQNGSSQHNGVQQMEKDNCDLGITENSVQQYSRDELQYLNDQWRVEIVGSATISLSRVEASLPPPFPSNKEFRMYITNVSVKDGWRRLGVATQLMKSAETVGFRWGESSCWLHVDDDNPGARSLYDKLGYKVVGADPWWKLANRRTLMMKTINKNNSLNQNPSTSIIQDVEGYRDEQGVFVWSAKVEEN